MTKARFLRLSYFAWIVPAGLVVGAYALFGLPYVIWSYEWEHNGHGYGEIDKRFYVRCSYLGPTGLITEYPTDGKCGWVRFKGRLGGAGSPAAGNEPNKRMGAFVAETEPLTQFEHRHVLDDIQHQRLVGFAVPDLLVAMVSRLECEAVGCDRRPKALIVHRGQPVRNVVLGSKSRHPQVYQSGLTPCKSDQSAGDGHV